MISMQSYLRATQTLIFTAASLHLIRIVMGMMITVGYWEVPAWLSMFIVALGYYLVFAGEGLARKKK